MTTVEYVKGRPYNITTRSDDGTYISIDRFQYANQGGHWFEYEKTRSRGELLMATAVPFLFHGCWDSGLDLIAYFFGMEGSAAAQAAGGVLLVAMLALGIVCTVRTLKKVRAAARST